MPLTYSKFAIFKYHTYLQKCLAYSHETLQECCSALCSYGLGVSLLDWCSMSLVIALDIVKICNFRLESHKAPKVFDLQSDTLQECWSAYVVVHLGFHIWIHLVLACLLSLTS